MGSPPTAGAAGLFAPWLVGCLEGDSDCLFCLAFFSDFFASFSFLLFKAPVWPVCTPELGLLPSRERVSTEVGVLKTKLLSAIASR